MNKATQSVVIVGGGTAGWLTAGRIAAEHRGQGIKGLSVTLVESPNVSPIGLGEGTWPTMRNTLMKMGISETEFIRQCDGSFKQGAKFAKWVDGRENDFYYHPLVLPQGFHKTNLAAHWARDTHLNSQSFSQAVCFQEAICELGLAPKTIRTPEYDAIANYAYHLDAAKFCAFLQKHCVDKLGVRHVLADVEQVHMEENGDIGAVITHQAGKIEGDLFVDCTGFSALLIDKHFQIPFKPCDDILFIDSALTVQVPYPEPESPIASHTISTAQPAGWIWDIGLQHRRGVGYAYASCYTTEEQAKQCLADYVGPQFAGLSVRKISIKSGHREKFWHKNCVAVGLSAGFLEPLEASALVLVELSAQMIAEQMPACREAMDVIANRFNQTFRYRWQRIIDFLKLHYVLSKRSDNLFWVDNRKPESIPDSLQELLTLWRYHTPGDHDFTSNNEVFPAASYQYILYGMGFHTDTTLMRHKLTDTQLAAQQFSLNQQAITKASDLLPTNRELINKIFQYGLQPI
ncbi:MAG: tryptophan halogenase [Paraglaciecola sp.]|jgi:tryptophan halogenase